MGLRARADQELEELKNVFEKMNDADIVPLMDEVLSAKKIVCYGAGREGLGLKFFVMRLMHLGLDAHWAMEDTAPGIGPGDVFFVSCGPGFYSHVVYLAEKAKEAGATVVTVTADPHSDIGKISDVICRLPAMAWRAKGDLVQSGQIMGNLYEQAAVLLFDIISQELKERLKLSDAEMEKRHRNYE